MAHLLHFPYSTPPSATRQVPLRTVAPNKSRAHSFTVEELLKDTHTKSSEEKGGSKRRDKVNENIEATDEPIPETSFPIIVSSLYGTLTPTLLKHSEQTSAFTSSSSSGSYAALRALAVSSRENKEEENNDNATDTRGEIDTTDNIDPNALDSPRIKYSVSSNRDELRQTSERDAEDNENVIDQTVNNDGYKDDSRSLSKKDFNDEKGLQFSQETIQRYRNPLRVSRSDWATPEHSKHSHNSRNHPYFESNHKLQYNQPTLSSINNTHGYYINSLFQPQYESSFNPFTSLSSSSFHSVSKTDSETSSVKDRYPSSESTTEAKPEPSRSSGPETGSTSYIKRISDTKLRIVSHHTA